MKTLRGGAACRVVAVRLSDCVFHTPASCCFISDDFAMQICGARSGLAPTPGKAPPVGPTCPHRPTHSLVGLDQSIHILPLQTETAALAAKPRASGGWWRQWSAWTRRNSGASALSWGVPVLPPQRSGSRLKMD